MSIEERLHAIKSIVDHHGHNSTYLETASEHAQAILDEPGLKECWNNSVNRLKKTFRRFF